MTVEVVLIPLKQFWISVSILMPQEKLVLYNVSVYKLLVHLDVLV